VSTIETISIRSQGTYEMQVKHLPRKTEQSYGSDCTKELWFVEIRQWQQSERLQQKIRECRNFERIARNQQMHTL